MVEYGHWTTNLINSGGEYINDFGYIMNTFSLVYVFTMYLDVFIFSIDTKCISISCQV